VEPKDFIVKPELLTELLASLQQGSPGVKQQKPVKGSVLPYSNQQLEALDKSLTDWLISLQIVAASTRSVTQVMQPIKTGVLLCDLVGLITNTKLIGVVRNPLT
jgi:hypothetical protein